MQGIPTSLTAAEEIFLRALLEMERGGEPSSSTVEDPTLAEEIESVRARWQKIRHAEAEVAREAPPTITELMQSSYTERGELAPVLDEAQRVYCEFLLTARNLDTPRFEELCSRNPRLEEKLRWVALEWAELFGAARRTAASPELADKLLGRYGEGEAGGKR